MGPGFCSFFTWGSFIGNTVIAIMLLTSHTSFYAVGESPQSPFIIKAGVLGYCSAMIDPPTKCVGPPPHIAWTFESVGKYLIFNDTIANKNHTKHVEQLQGSIKPSTTRSLGVTTVILLVLSLIGSIISSILQIVYCKWDQTGSKFRIKRSLAYILIGTASLSFFASFVTLAAGHITGSEIGNRIREATSNALQLTKLKGVTINIFRNGVDTGQTAKFAMNLLIGPPISSTLGLVFAIISIPQRLAAPRDPNVGQEMHPMPDVSSRGTHRAQ